MSRIVSPQSERLGGFIVGEKLSVGVLDPPPAQEGSFCLDSTVFHNVGFSLASVRGGCLYNARPLCRESAEPALSAIHVDHLDPLFCASEVLSEDVPDVGSLVNPGKSRLANAGRGGGDAFGADAVPDAPRDM